MEIFTPKIHIIIVFFYLTDNYMTNGKSDKFPLSLYIHKIK